MKPADYSDARLAGMSTDALRDITDLTKPGRYTVGTQAAARAILSRRERAERVHDPATCYECAIEEHLSR